MFPLTTRFAVVLSVFAAVTAAAFSGDLPIVGKTVLPSAPRGAPIGRWSHGAFIRVQAQDSANVLFRIYDKAGLETGAAAFTLDKASLINIASDRFARSTDGYIAVAGSAYTDDNQGATFLAILSPDGQRQTVLRTSPYAVLRLAFAVDGTIWTAGRELESGQDVNPGHLIVRRYSRDGKMLGGALARSEFPGRTHPAVLSHLVTSADRIGWYSSAARTYVEFSLDGQEIARYPALPQAPDGVAMCSDGSVWLSSRASDAGGAPLNWSLASLDRSARSWTLGPAKTAPLYIFGCDGSSLASQGASGANVVEWVSTR